VDRQTLFRWYSFLNCCSSGCRQSSKNDRPCW
jgi:hypothetical protein